MARVARRTLMMVVAIALLTACTTDARRDVPDGDAQGDTPSEAVDPEADEAEAEEAAPDPPPCRHDELAEEALIELTGDDEADVAGQVAATTHDCAPVVVVAPTDDPWAAGLAAPIARAADAPLLLSTDDGDALTSLLASFGAEELVTVGSVVVASSLPRTELLAPEADAENGDDDDATEAATDDAPDEDLTDDLPDEDLRRVGLAVRVADHLDTPRFLAVDAQDDDLRGAALARLEADVALLPLPMEELGAATEQLPASARVEVLAADADEATRVADELIGLGIDAQPTPTEGPSAWPAAGTTVWLVDPADGATAAVGAVAAAGRDEALLPIDAGDPRSDRDRTTRLRDAGADRHVLLGGTDDARWQLETVLDGEPFPWGGFRLFEDERMVALYGSVETAALGALGEQGLDATVDRLRTFAEPYGGDGARVLPAFELITTIASGSEEPTGDYSRRTPIESLRPWVDRAAEEELYVMLDLQPGRTDFLTQAKEYEELLLEPHVGLALDPEWRLGPEELHLRQIGSVDAEEVQEVADWLAALTREHRLPEKLLVLHQFRFSMLPDRETIVAPPELAVVVHMDGQGPIGSKYETYGALTGGVEDRWLWGWKNFYDEDSPTPTPEQVLALDPLPVFVTYQ